MSTKTFYYVNDPAITLDKFFEGIDVKNLMRDRAFFQPFQSAKVDYPMDSWFNDEFWCIEIPIVQGKAEDIEITKTSDQLRVKYMRSDKETVGQRTYVRKGMVRKDFDQAWRLTSKFDSSKISTTFENGLLSIFIPFAKEAIPEKIPVLDVSGNWKKVAEGKSLTKGKLMFKNRSIEGKTLNDFSPEEIDQMSPEYVQHLTSNTNQ